MKAQQKDQAVKDLAARRSQEIKGGAPRKTLRQRTAAFEKAVTDNTLTDGEYANIN